MLESNDKNKTYSIVKYLYTLTFLCLFILLNGQNFPEAWSGKWTGEVEVWNPSGQMDAFPMYLDIQPTDTLWTWTIFYGHGQLPEPDLRNYSLLIINDSIGHYAIDEHNGIILDAHLVDNCLSTAFGGMGSELLIDVCKEEDHLNYKITSFYAEPQRVSGDLIMGTDTIPPINSYEVYHVMKAVLSRED